MFWKLKKKKKKKRKRKEYRTKYITIESVMNKISTKT